MSNSVFSSGSTPSSSFCWGNAFDKVTSHAVWRHTVGRISCALRIPFYAVATVAQAAKTATKAIIATITLNQLSRLGPTGHKFTFQAVARDAIGTLALADRTANSAFSVIFAPPKHYRSFSESIRDSGKLIFRDNYHAKGDKVYKVKEVFDAYKLKRAEYSNQLFSCIETEKKISAMNLTARKAG